MQENREVSTKFFWRYNFVRGMFKS